MDTHTARSDPSMDETGLESHIRRDLPRLTAEDAKQLALVLRRLVDVFSPERIYAFGSHARGDARSDSDVDLLVVVSSSDLPGYRLAQAAYRAISPHTIAVDILMMTHDEFDWRSGSPASLPSTVLREGKMLYAAPVPA